MRKRYPHRSSQARLKIPLEVAEEAAVARAEMVVALFAVERQLSVYPIFGAATKTHLHDIAVQASLREAVNLVHPEVAVAFHHVVERTAHDVADAVLVEHIAVAAINVAIALDSRAVAANALVHAETSGTVSEVAHGGLECLHKLPTHIATFPAVEHIAEELSVALGRDRERRNLRSFCGYGRVNSWREGYIAVLPDTLQHGQELHIVGNRAQKAIHLCPAVGVGGIDGSERVVLNACLAQHFDGVHDPAERAAPRCILAVAVVQMLRAVDAYADAEVVVGEEATPVVVEECAVGL